MYFCLLWPSFLKQSPSLQICLFEHIHLLKEAAELLSPGVAKTNSSGPLLVDGLCCRQSLRWQTLRALTIIDYFTSESFVKEVLKSITGLHVSLVLDWLCEIRGIPKAITVGHGPELTGSVLDKWVY